jgi:hypothetical protein
MGKNKIDLREGIRLEISGTLIPWKTNFRDLENIGRPEKKVQSDREIIIWKNERILNGLKVDLSAVYEKGPCGHNSQLTSLCAYLGEGSFQEARKQLEEQIRKLPKFSKLNNVEYTYTWKLGNCSVVLSHLDRFGSFWKLEIKLEPALSGALSIKNILNKLFRRRRERIPFDSGQHMIAERPSLAVV